MKSAHVYNCIRLLLLLCIVPVFTLQASGADEEQEIAFKYGIIGMSEDKPDNLFEVSDGSTLYSGDYFKINFKVETKSHFYVILKASDESYLLYYSQSNIDGSDQSAGAETSLDWLQLDDSVGEEKIFLISTLERQTILEELFNKYNSSEGKVRDKYQRKIGVELIAVTSDDLEESPTLKTRLDRPEMVGATFRGIAEDEYLDIKANFLFNHSKGRSVASEVITIKHVNK